MPDDGPGLVVVEEESSPCIGSNSDVGEEVARLEISANICDENGVDWCS